MDCVTAEPFVSMLYDGEEAPEEAVQHITACTVCRARLREYAAMASEIRVLAAAEAQNLQPMVAPADLPSRRRWRFTLGSPVRVPRFALVMGIAIIAGLSVALGYVEKKQRRQDLWFACDFRLPQSQFWGPFTRPTSHNWCGASRRRKGCWVPGRFSWWDRKLSSARWRESSTLRILAATGWNLPFVPSILTPAARA